MRASSIWGVCEPTWIRRITKGGKAGEAFHKEARSVGLQERMDLGKNKEGNRYYSLGKGTHNWPANCVCIVGVILLCILNKGEHVALDILLLVGVPFSERSVT